jgi:hypothetical protein
MTLVLAHTLLPVQFFGLCEPHLMSFRNLIYGNGRVEG